MRVSGALLLSLTVHLIILLSFGQPGSGALKPVQDRLAITVLAPPGSETQAVAALEVPAAVLDRPVVKSNQTPVPRRAKSQPKVERPPPAKPLEAATPVPLNDVSLPAPGLPLPLVGMQIRHVAIDFEVYAGEERRLIGHGQHRYVSDLTEHFGITVKGVPESEGSGEVDPWSIDIAGSVGRLGLSPARYQMQGDLPHRLMSLKSRTDKTAAEAARKWRMPDGTLDRQSLLYYFMFKPPQLLGGQLWLSDDTSHSLFSYRINGIESLALGSSGQVSTVRVRLTTDASSESIELWLLPDRNYLPVKAKYIDAQGAITEQVATALEFD